MVAGGGLTLALQLLASSFNPLGHFKPQNLFVGSLTFGVNSVILVTINEF